MVDITVCVPAYNEEKALAQTVKDICTVANAAQSDIEIIIVDDGSADRTGEIADDLARNDPRILAFHQKPNKGVGAAFKLVLERASSDRITLIPGDYAFDQRGLEDLFRNANAAELLITYRANKASRPPLRRLLSTVFSSWLRLMTHCPIRDGHSLYVFPVARTRTLADLMPDDHRYHVVALVNLLRRANSYAEIPVELRPRADQSSTVLRVSFLLKITATMLGLTLSAIRGDQRMSRPKVIVVQS